MKPYEAFAHSYDEALHQRTKPLLALLSLQAVRSCYRDKPDSQVYLVEDKEERRYILKCGRAERAASLKREYDLLSKLDHPAVPKAIRLVEQADWTFLLRTYVPGTSLDAYAQSGGLSIPQAVSILQKASDVIAYLHAQTPPIIHRDIKAENFIVTHNGQLVLIDLDTAQTHDPDKARDTLFMGTAAVAAPEQYGARRSNMRTDVYGLGMLFAYLLTNDYDLSALEPLRVPCCVRRIIRKSTSFDPDQRYGTVQKFTRALRHVRLRSHTRPVRWRLALSGLLIAVMLAISFLYGIPGTARFSRANSQTVQAPVFFHNTLFAEAAALQLDKAAETLTHADLAGITQLYISGSVPLPEISMYRYYTPDSMDYWAKIDSPLDHLSMPGIDALDDLALFPNLRHLGLYQQRITDIEMLSGMQLETLALSGCPVEDFTPIAGMDTLKSLDIAYTKAGDGSFLSGLTKLVHLRVDGTGIDDLSVVTGAPITSLYVAQNNIRRDREILLSFTALTALEMPRVGAEEVAVIGQMTGLQQMNLGHYPYADLTPLSKLDKLRWLLLTDSALTSLEGVESLRLLEMLQVPDSGIVDLVPLRALTGLEALWVNGNPIASFDALQDMPLLRGLWVDARQARTLVPQDYSFNINIVE